MTAAVQIFSWYLSVSMVLVTDRTKSDALSPSFLICASVDKIWKQARREIRLEKINVKCSAVNGTNYATELCHPLLLAMAMEWTQSNWKKQQVNQPPTLFIGLLRTPKLRNLKPCVG